LDYFTLKVNGAIDAIQSVQKDINLKEKKREGIHLRSAVSCILYSRKDLNRAVDVIDNILEMFEKIEDVNEKLLSQDVEVFLSSHDRLNQSIEYLRRNTTNVGAAEKLAELESITFFLLFLYSIIRITKNRQDQLVQTLSRSFVLSFAIFISQSCPECCRKISQILWIRFFFSFGKMILCIWVFFNR
jgi:hypothetical protein